MPHDVVVTIRFESEKLQPIGLFLDEVNNLVEAWKGVSGCVIDLGVDGSWLNVSTNLTEARRARGLTQRDLARIAGVGAATINIIERGHRAPRPSTLRRINLALSKLDANHPDGGQNP